MPSGVKEIRINLRTRITCPHCWETFPPEETLWVAAHPDLLNDARLGSDKPQRFLPTRFNPEGNAIDIRGVVCQDLACPRCHLIIPRALLELPPIFISIAGTPSCGKTYFLAAMTWMLRQTLPRDFCLSYSDADAQSNFTLNKYEEDQFLNPDPDAIVKLLKTDPHAGDGYDYVSYGEQRVMYPRPFLFTIRPTQQHPSATDASCAGLERTAVEQNRRSKSLNRNPRYWSLSRISTFPYSKNGRGCWLNGACNYRPNWNETFPLASTLLMQNCDRLNN